MDIRPIDLADDALMAQMYAVVVAVRRYQRPHFVATPAAAAIGELRHLDPGETTHLWGIWEGDTLAGVVTAWLNIDDNTDKVWTQIDVHPDHRRRGHGTRAVEMLVDFARANGRTQIVVESKCPAEGAQDHPYRIFAERNGFRLGQTEIIRLLDLPVADVLLAGLADEARAAYRGRYRVQTFTQVPRELWPSLLTCMNRVGADAPTGEIDWEPETLGPDRYAGNLDLDRSTGRIRLTSVAIEESSGDVVAFTELGLAPDITRAHQWGTLVLAEHRGHRLGLAVKVAGLGALQTDHPDRVDIVTGNAHNNPWMVSINERLGFRPIELGLVFHRTV